MTERGQVLECLHCGEVVVLDEHVAVLDALLASFMAAHLTHGELAEASFVVSWVAAESASLQALPSTRTGALRP